MFQLVLLAAQKCVEAIRRICILILDVRLFVSLIKFPTKTIRNYPKAARITIFLTSSNSPN